MTNAALTHRRIAARHGSVIVLCGFMLVPVATTRAQTPPQSGQKTPGQTQADDYTRYELLAPGSGTFRILYDVTATTPGATHFFNPIRVGSIATDERVFDRATGKPLTFSVVSANVARAGGVRVTDTTQRYIREIGRASCRERV